MADAPAHDRPTGATGVLAMADGTVVWGIGLGAEGAAVGEVCFNTAMTGYQEAMTDPSYAGQIITFTTPHIGNTGANPEDVEATNPHALGCIVAAVPSEAASWRATGTFDTWLKSWGRIGLAGVDTRALTRRIREAGAPNAVIAHSGERRVRHSRRCSRRRRLGRGSRAWTSPRPCRRRRATAGTTGCGRWGRATRPTPPTPIWPARRRGRLRHEAQHPAQSRRRRRSG